MNIDRIIARFLPVIGAVFFVIGLGYLIYTSVWLTVTQLVKVEIGLFTSLLLIGLGYSFQEKLKYYADIIIGSGILLFYGTLIYASRTTDVATAIFPEYLSLIVALVFTVSVSYFAKVRSSKAILALALLGAYLTPFVIGQEGEWQYALSYNSYLLYFFSVNLSVYALSRTLFLGDIVPLNSIGLLVGATMLKTLAYPTPVNASENFFAGDGMSGILFVLIVSVYVIALARTNRQFPEAYARFTPFGYILPFFWFIWSVSTLNISTYDFVGMYMFLSAVYLGSWHLLKSQDDQKTGRIFLYVG